MNYPREINYRRYAVYIIAGFVLWFYLFLVLLQNEVYDSLVLENGQTEFTASFETVKWIVAANDDPEMAEVYEASPVQLTIEVLDSAGSSVAYLEMNEGWITSNGYVSTDDFQMNGCPFFLTVGETYTFQYWAYVNGEVTGNLSFVLYGSAGQMLTEALVLGVLAVIAAAALLLTEYAGDGPAGGLFTGAGPGPLLHREHAGNGRNGEAAVPVTLSRVSGGLIRTAGYIAIWLALSGMLLVSAPAMMDNEEERTSFANAYAISNTILGQDAADDDGYVYVEESGLREMGNISDPQSLHRFWTNWSDGNDRESGKVSTLYVRSDVILSPVTWLDGAAIALARILKAPYQVVYLSGVLVNLAAGFVMMLAVLYVLRLAEANRRRARAAYGRNDTPLRQAGEKARQDGISRRRDRQEPRPDTAASRPLSMLIAAIFLLPSMLHGMMSYGGVGVYAALGILLILVLAQRGVPGRKLCIAAITVCLILCGIRAAFVIPAGENVLMAAVRSVTWNLNEWLFALVYIGSETAAGSEFVCLVLIMLLVFLAARCMTQSGAAAGVIRDTEQPQPDQESYREPDRESEQAALRLRYLWEILVLLCVYLGFLSVGGRIG